MVTFVILRLQLLLILFLEKNAFFLLSNFLFFAIGRISYVLGVRLPNLANKNTGYPAIYEIPAYLKNISHVIFGATIVFFIKENLLSPQACCGTSPG